MTKVRPEKFKFSKAERLTGKKKIEELFNVGSSIFFTPIFAQIPITRARRVSFVDFCSKKKIKRAVDRNQIRRRIREAYRLNKSLILHNSRQCFDVAIIYQASEILSFQEIEKKLINLLKRLKKEIHAYEKEC